VSSRVLFLLEQWVTKLSQRAVVSPRPFSLHFDAYKEKKKTRHKKKHDTHTHARRWVKESDLASQRYTASYQLTNMPPPPVRIPRARTCVTRFSLLRSRQPAVVALISSLPYIFLCILCRCFGVATSCVASLLDSQQRYGDNVADSCPHPYINAASTAAAAAAASAAVCPLLPAPLPRVCCRLYQHSRGCRYWRCFAAAAVAAVTTDVAVAVAPVTPVAANTAGAARIQAPSNGLRGGDVQLLNPE
jgi:hypothetical protein